MQLGHDILQTSPASGEGILLWVHRNSAEATRRVDAALDLGLSVDRQPTSMFRCASSLLTRPSVIAADGGTLITGLLQSSHALLLCHQAGPDTDGC